MQLTDANVRAIMNYVLYKTEEVPDKKPPPDAVVVRGIARTYGFHPGRLKEKREDVRALLRQLSDNFHKSKGGGWSFLNMCMDREGRHWGEHQICEDLMCLGVGVNMVEYCLPHSEWAALPGQMPYFMIDTDVA